ncbi:MAG: glycosyltransferase family 1 protein [Pseudomonadota bacterium]
MRIVINALSARLGGGQTYLHNLLQHVPQGWQIWLLAPATLVVGQSTAVQRIEIPSSLGNPFLRAVWERLHLPRLLRELEADVLFCPGGMVNTLVPAHCRVVTMSRNMMPFDIEQRRKYPWGYDRLRLWLLEKLLLRSMLRADLLIFISEHARRIIGALADRALPASVVIPHGINDEFRVDLAHPLAWPQWVPQQPYFFYASTLDYYKAQIEVVQGFARYKQCGGAEKLILAGPENVSYGNKLRREIARLGMQLEVLLPGKIPYYELPAMYQHARINLFASYTENCPNILLEMMAAGRPILCSNRQPMPEFGGDAVQYFDPANPSQFAAQLAALNVDAGRMDALGRSAAVRASSYDWRLTAQRTWQALGGVVAADRRK